MVHETIPDTQYGRQAWRAAVAAVAERAKAALPESHGRIDAAIKLVLAGDVVLQPDGTAEVASQSQGTVTYLSCNGHCTCQDYDRAPQHLCKHRLGHAIALRAQQTLAQHLDAGVTLQNGSQATFPPDVTQESGASPQIDPKWLVLIAGKPFVRYAGLLDAAHKAGLVSLTATWTANEPELSLAHAVAVFADGRRFEECGDAAPATVSSMVAKHFRRVSLTRAKARALRDALGCDLVAVEELE